MRGWSVVAGGLLLVLAAGGCRSPETAGPDPSAVEHPTEGVAGPVQGQLAAYNAHDLERFLSYYAPDVQIHQVGRDGTSLVEGKDAMRKAYAFLTKAPDGFRAEIVSRLVAGRYVIDHERIVAPGYPTMEALAIYEVSDSVITRVWFLPDP